MRWYIIHYGYGPCEMKRIYIFTISPCALNNYRRNPVTTPIVYYGSLSKERQTTEKCSKGRERQKWTAAVTGEERSSERRLALSIAFVVLGAMSMRLRQSRYCSSSIW